MLPWRGVWAEGGQPPASVCDTVGRNPGRPDLGQQMCPSAPRSWDPRPVRVCSWRASPQVSEKM